MVRRQHAAGGHNRINGAHAMPQRGMVQHLMRKRVLQSQAHGGFVLPKREIILAGALDQPALVLLQPGLQLSNTELVYVSRRVTGDNPDASAITTTKGLREPNGEACPYSNTMARGWVAPCCPHLRRAFEAKNS